MLIIFQFISLATGFMGFNVMSLFKDKDQRKEIIHRMNVQSRDIESLSSKADRGSAEVEHWTSDLRVPGSIPAWGEKLGVVAGD